MAIDLSGLVPVQRAAVATPRVTLPGGLVIQGTTESLTAGPLAQARATLGAANVALAPLGPVFAVIDAVVAIKDFAVSVPKVIIQPGEVLKAIETLISKVDGLVSLVPQLSVPLMVLGIVDSLALLLEGLGAELAAIAAHEDRVEEASAQVASTPGLGPVLEGVTAQLKVQRESLAGALGHAAPLLDVLNAFSALTGAAPIGLGEDLATSSTRAASEQLLSLAAVLRAARAAIPF